MFFQKISRQALVHDLFFLTLSNVLLQLLGFSYRVFLSRAAGAEGMGIYSLVMPFYSLLSSLTLTGLTVAVARISSARHALGDDRGARVSVSRSFLLFSLSVAILGAITFFGRGFVLKTLLGDLRAFPSVPFLFICLFLTGFENILKNYFYGVGRVAPQITSELSEQAIRFLAVFLLLSAFGTASAQSSVVLIVCGMIISELSSVFILNVFYRFGKRKFSSVGKPPKIRELLSISIPVSASASINNLLALLNSALIPQRLCAAGLTRRAATEVFGITFGMTMPLLSFPIAFIASLTSVIVPRLSASRATGNVSDMRRKAAKTIHATGLLAMPVIAIMIPLASPLERLIFSHSSADSLILPLCIATLISYYEISLGALLNAIGKQKRSALYIVIGGIIQLIFTWAVGIPGVGLSAFALGAIVSGLATALLQFSCLCRELSLFPRFANWFFFPLLAATLASLLTKAVYSLSFSLALSALFGFFAYALALSALGTNPIRYIKTLIPKNLQ